MSIFQTNKISQIKQFVFSTFFISIVAGICYLLSNKISYQIIAFILLMAVSFVAIIFDIWPVLLTASLSALIWNFFFIPPLYSFKISNPDDVLFFLMYFVIALVSSILTAKIRQIEKTIRIREEKANTVKLYNTLLNSLSHELRTPISTIIGATDNLQNNATNLSQQNKDDLLNEISKASFRLNQQVENLLNMSRLESGFIQPKNDWCDINEAVYDVVKRMEENNISQKIQIDIPANIPFFKIDMGMMEQVIYNLVNNASIYTDIVCTINIAVSCHNDVLKIIIEDNGKGFPEDEIKKVFEKFYRLKNSKTGGTGLGLSIVKGFVDAMGGKIELHNVIPNGAKFTILIPCETSYIKNIKNE